MGLLDDAIREHMELKRLRGADPSEVAREEQDALGPIVFEQHAEPRELEDGPADAGQIAPDGQKTVAEDAAHVEDDPPIAPQPAREQDIANIGQETAELDMRTVLHGEPGDEGDSRGEEQVEDVLEETPDFLRDTPEQERLWFEQQPPRDFDFDK